MTTRVALKESLKEFIDYAGLFPPAALGLSAAVQEFWNQSADPDLGWLFRRFVLPVAPVERCREIVAALSRAPEDIVSARDRGAPVPSWGERVPVSLLLPGVNAGSEGSSGSLVAALRGAMSETESVLRLLEETPQGSSQRLSGGAPFSVETVEWALPLTSDAWGPSEASVTREVLGALHGRLPKAEVYLEVAWQQWSPEALAHLMELKAALPCVSAKIRTGGLTVAAIPPPAPLLRVLRDLVSHGVEFKCTAGLHAALFETSPRFGFEMHGFLNLLAVTACLADGKGVPDTDKAGETHETQLLELMTEQNFERFWSRLERLLGSDVEHKLLAARRHLHSFGSCSVVEPRDSLRVLGI